jgi:hypothetical protein
MSLENKIIMVLEPKTQKTTEKFYANYPNIRTLKGFLEGEWNLQLFDKCFKGKNRLGDVDASIELNGYTLLIEFKSARNGMNQGQVLKAIRQAKYSGITTLFVFGKRNNPEAYLKIEPDASSEKGFKHSGYVPADLDAVCDQILRWVKWTEENSLVTDRTAEWEAVSEVMGALYK